jgi:hypothetical protein
MERLDRHITESLSGLFDFIEDLSPSLDRIIIVQETGMSDLFSIFFDTHIDGSCHTFGAIQCYGPCQFSSVFFGKECFSPVVHGFFSHHDFGRIDIAQVVFILFSQDRNSVIDTFDVPHHFSFG